MSASITNNGGSQFDIVIGGIVVATIDGTGLATGIKAASITESKLATAVKPLGVGQTWQQVTRTNGVTYTNTTGRTIYGNRANLAGGAAVQTMTIAISGGTPICIAAGDYSTTPNRVDVVGHYLVPDGATYVFSDASVGAITTYELR